MERMKKAVLSVIISVLMVGCAAQQPLIKPTQSGLSYDAFSGHQS
jgi:uncharacterized protein YcfL